MVLSFGAILDPRYKLNIVEFYLSKLGMKGPLLIDKVQSVDDELRKLYSEYDIQPNVMQGLTKGPSSNVGDENEDEADEKELIEDIEMLITSSHKLSLPSITPTTLPSIQITHEAEETATMPHDSPLPGGHTPGSDEGRMQHTKLMELITKLTHRIEALEKDLQQTKKTYSTALTKLVLKVKKLEKQVRSGKAKRRDRIVLLEDEDVEDIETQEKNSADTEVLLKEATPTELIEDLGSGEKGKKEISIADVPISTAGAEVSTTSHDVSTASQKTLVLLLRRSAQRQRTRKGSIKEGSSGEQEKAMAEQGSKKDLFEAALELQKYHALQNRPYYVAEVRKNMVMYLKNQAGYKQSYFKGMKYEEIRPIFEKVWDQTHTFVPMDSEDKEKDSEKKGSRQKITGRKKRQ
ncbi:ribonuclease H-like domain-containing protein [Tanacetum coccineum]